jgi:serine protease Do
MSRRVRVIKLVQHAIMFIPLSLSLISTDAAGQDAALPDLVDRVSPSVVSIFVEMTEPATANAPNADKNPTPAKPKMNQGAGWVLTPEGHIVTVLHVVDKAQKITIVLADGTRHEAQVVGRDARTAIALLKVTPAAPLTPVRFADSDQLRRGQYVFSIGNPFGLQGSVSSGIISALGRNMGAAPYLALQTDAVVYPGSAGAPLFNSKGDVVGMASSIYSVAGKPTEIGFAIPSNVLKEIAEKLHKFGVVNRGWLGIQIRRPTEQESHALGLERGSGLIVVKLIEGGSAQNTGLAAGDAIVSLNGRAVHDPAAFARAVLGEPPGTEVTLGVIEKSGRSDIRVKLGRLADQQSAGTTATPEKSTVGALGCFRYVPSAGLTVSAPCED